MPLTILITGFGPFPAAPFNPTEALVRRLARVRRPAFAEVRLVPHVFTTSYEAVDRDLPLLIARHAPDAILMFGLAARRHHDIAAVLGQRFRYGAADASRGPGNQCDFAAKISHGVSLIAAVVRRY